MKREDKLLEFIKKLIELECRVSTDHINWFLEYREYRVKVPYNIGSSVFINDFWRGHSTKEMTTIIKTYHRKYEDIDFDLMLKDINKDLRKKKLEELNGGPL